MGDPATDLLLRNSVEVTLIVDADAAADLPDSVLDEVLGRAAREQVRTILEEEG